MSAICLAAGSLHAATFTWNGSAGDWYNTNNWTPAGLPATNDTINFNSGTINLSAPVLIAGQFNWNGGTISNTSLTIASNGVMVLGSGSTKILWTSLTNAGTVTWTGGNFEVDYSSANNQFGFIQNLPGGLFDIQNSAQIYNGSAVNGAAFQNAGMLRKSVNSSGFTFALPLVNTGGTVSNLTGTLNFNIGGVIEGGFSASAGATISFTGGMFTYNAPATVNGPGTVQVNGATLTLVSNAIPNLTLTSGTFSLGPNFQAGGVITNLAITGGTLTGNNIVSGTFTNGAALPGSLTLLSGAVVNWTGGSIQGPVMVPVGATLNLTGSSIKYLWGALTNAGTVIWGGTSTLEVDYSTTASQFGLIVNLPGALFDVQSSQTLSINSPNGTIFQNLGTFRKSSDVNTTTISIPFINSGLVTNIQGVTRFVGGGTIEGTFGAAAGATINFNTGNFVYNTPPTLTGTGTIQITGGTLTLASNTIPNLQLAGATVTLGQNFQGGTITNLTVLSGTLNGNIVVSGVFSNGASMPGSLTVLSGATATWSAGTMQGPINIGAGGTLNLVGSSQKYLWGPLTNAGTVTWTGGGNFEIDNSSANGQFGLAVNLPGGLWDIQNSQTMAIGGVPFFQNGGTFRKSADNNTTQINVLFNNTGIVTAQVGTISFRGGGNIQGTFTTASGATVDFHSGNFTYAVPPVLSGGGAFQFTGGTMAFANNTIPNLQIAGGTVTLGQNFQGGIITNLTLASGSIVNTNLTVSGTFNTAAALPGSLTLLPGATVNWSGGSIQGPVNVASGATLNLTGSAYKYLWGPLTNAGTVTWNGGGSLEVDYSSVFNQFGLIVNLPGALWDIQSSQTLSVGSPNGTFFQNAGTFRKSADGGTTSINIAFNNSGTVNVLQGTLSFKGGGVMESVFLASFGATINFNSGAFVYNMPPTMTGAGTFQITGGTLTLASNTIPNLQLAGGTITLGPNFQGGTITNLTLTAGTLNGNNIVSGTLNVSATMPGGLTVLSGATANWSGGSISGPVNVASGGALNITGNSSKSLWNALTNSGTVTWSGTANLQVDYSTAQNRFGTIQNLAGALWDIQNSQNLQNQYGNIATFQNAGTVQKSADTGTTGIAIPFINVGTTKALSGTITFNGGANLAGGTLINGIGASSGYGQFNIPGVATLTSALTVQWLTNYVPALSNVFTLVSYGSRTGTFSPFTAPSSANWITNYGTTALTLTVAGINKLQILANASNNVAGAILTPMVVQVIDSVTSNSIPTNGLPVTVALTTGTGTLSGTLTRNTDATGKATFNDLSINLVGVKGLTAYAPGAATPVSGPTFSISPANAAKLAILTPIGAKQQDGGLFVPSPVVQVQDAFGNTVPGSTAPITATSTATGSGTMAGTVTVNANGTSGQAAFNNLYYNLGNSVTSETVTPYFTSPGLVPATNGPVFVNFIFGLIKLTSGNSVVRINPNTQDGVYSWTVDGTEKMYQEWFWLRQDPTNAQTSFDDLGSPLGAQLTATNAIINYVTASLNVNLGFALAGGAPGSGMSDLTETISIQNTTNGPITLHLFKYSDFDLSPNADTIAFPANNSPIQTGGTNTMTETVQSPQPNFYESSYYALTLNKILAPAPVTLSNTILNPAPGDQTFANQWDLALAPGQTVVITLTQSIRVIPGGHAIVQSGPVFLNIEVKDNYALVWWPTNDADGFRLQSVDALTNGAKLWLDVTNEPAAVDDNYEVVLPIDSGAKYFRLQR
jgi:hypothetical protein